MGHAVQAARDRPASKDLMGSCVGAPADGLQLTTVVAVADKCTSFVDRQTRKGPKIFDPWGLDQRDYRVVHRHRGA